MLQVHKILSLRLNEEGGHECVAWCKCGIPFLQHRFWRADVCIECSGERSTYNGMGGTGVADRLGYRLKQLGHSLIERPQSLRSRWTVRGVKLSWAVSLQDGRKLTSRLPMSYCLKLSDEQLSAKVLILEKLN